MINFIKQAVESVEGIKSFLFNTDYRNNFDLQDVEFPCCVLTPIMSKKYDLKNIIRESAELQLSVVDLAPYEYTGDDLYDINKRCSDLALQVIANLQVKSKLDKELTFEFILPSGDELISGVMCNLQCTMKQGSCNGAPSYVEVIVQPIKRESITSNGKHVITPSKGFNAMREVEVDVQIGELTTEEKIVDITSNGEVEILPTSADAMTKVTANVQVPPPPLEETKTETITTNGTHTITPTEGNVAMKEVSVEVDIQGFDFGDLQGASVINEQFEYALSNIEDIKADITRNYQKGLDWDNIGQAINTRKYVGFFPYVPLLNPITTASSCFSDCLDLIYIDERYDFTNCRNLRYLCLRCISLRAFKCNINSIACTDAAYIFSQCFNLTELSPIYLPNNKSLEYAFYSDYNLKEVNITTDLVESMKSGFDNCRTIKKITLTSIRACANFTSIFSANYKLKELRFTEWRQGNISLVNSNVLSAESIHYIIQNSMSKADGAVDRKLSLHATAKTNWINSEYYQQDLAVLLDKGITIA